MKKLILGMALLTAAAAGVKAEPVPSNYYNEVLRLNGGKPASRPAWGVSWSGVHQKLASGAVRPAERVTLQGSFLRAGATYVPKSGRAQDFHVATELGFEKALGNGLGLMIVRQDDYDSHPGPRELSSESRWLASLSLRFGR